MTDKVSTYDSSIDSAASALSAGLGAMLRDGMRFVEAKSIGNTPPNYACEGCAFVGHPVLCAKAIDGAAKAAFGGDCDERDVIYVEAHNVKFSGTPAALSPEAPLERRVGGAP